MGSHYTITKGSKKGYLKILLAFIEDLLDFDNIDQVIAAPAYTALSNSPFTSIDLIKKIISEVRRRERGKDIPKNPREILTHPLRHEAEEEIEKGKTNKDKVVFVVRGRNDKAKDAMCEFLRSIGLFPLLFEEAVIKSGKTSPYIGEVLETAFSLAQAVVVLMTPDDEGQLRRPLRRIHELTYETELTPQPRMNVVFEAGMAMGIAKNRTVLVELGNLRPFSDISGRHRVMLDNSIEKRKDLIGRLQNAGCSVDLTKDDYQDVGDFDLKNIRKVMAYLFFPAETPEKDKTLDYHSKNLHHRLIVNHKTTPPKAYYLTSGSYGWKFIQENSDKWVSQVVISKEYTIDDPDFTENWCKKKGYQLHPRVAEKEDLLESD